MTPLTPEETRRHIRFKASCHELDPVVADRMLRLHDEDPSLDYRALQDAALCRDLPDTAYHVSGSENMLSILEHGLRISNPARGWRGTKAAGQTPAVYLSDLQEATGGRHSHTLPADVWRVDGLHALAPEWRQDPMNPTCWAVLAPIPARMLSLHHTIP
jgi:hypothetical protein